MDDRPIGVFDSGFGGVSVLAAATQVLPQEDFIFFGDNLHAPYGDRTPQEVLRYTHESIDTLVSLGCKAIVIACNTATSAAGATLRAELSLPIIGMEPALKPAALLPQDGRVIVMATAMTLALEKFHNLMQLYGQDALPVPCPGLVELVEMGETNGPRIQARLEALLAPCLNEPVKAVVLGCTHYIFLRRALTDFLPKGVALVDGNLGTVRQLQKQLARHGLLKREPVAPDGPDATAANVPPIPGTLTFLSSSPDAAIPQRMRTLFAAALADLDIACISHATTVQ